MQPLAVPGHGPGDPQAGHPQATGLVPQSIDQLTHDNTVAQFDPATITLSGLQFCSCDVSLPSYEAKLIDSLSQSL